MRTRLSRYGCKRQKRLGEMPNVLLTIISKHTVALSG
jgi:hypothetical protein